MKKLSIEEKAKAYDEALKEAVIAHKDEDRHPKATLERIFQELKESEDESMIQYFKDLAPFDKAYELYEKYGFSHKDAIAWLEKQCVYDKFINGIQVGDKVTRNEDGVLVNLSQLNRVAKKKVEQKTTDKVEPNFKVGDWVVYCNDDIDLITGIEENGYCINNSGHIPFICASDIRLWTIQDAKDGDVLAWDDSKCIALFKKIYDEDSFNSYGFVGGCTGTFESRQSYHDIEGAHPATKEQRDLLFHKMHEAGYEWDAEKKSIVDLKKKVELKPFDKVVVRCSEADRWSIDFFSYKAPNGYICTGDAWFGYCLPYNEETAKLIGTTINMEV